MKEKYKPLVEHQHELNPTIQEEVRKDVLKLLDVGIIYRKLDRHWVSQYMWCWERQNYCGSKWKYQGKRICIDCRKQNNATRKCHFLLPFIDKILEKFKRHSHYCFLDGYIVYNQILIVLNDQEKATFTCPLMALLCIGGCHSVCAKPQLRSCDVWCLYSLHDRALHWGVHEWFFT